jgi:hypothetical protein
MIYFFLQHKVHRVPGCECLLALILVNTVPLLSDNLHSLYILLHVRVELDRIRRRFRRDLGSRMQSFASEWATFGRTHRHSLNCDRNPKIQVVDTASRGEDDDRDSNGNFTATNVKSGYVRRLYDV